MIPLRGHTQKDKTTLMENASVIVTSSGQCENKGIT